MTTDREREELVKNYEKTLFLSGTRSRRTLSKSLMRENKELRERIETVADQVAGNLYRSTDGH